MFVLFLLLLLLLLLGIYYYVLAMPIAIGSIVIFFIERTKELISKHRFGTVALMYSMSVAFIPLFVFIFEYIGENDILLFSFLLIFLCAAGGALVFAFYYLLYKRTLKKTGIVQPSSLVVRMPLVTGCVNLVLGIVFCIFFYLGKILRPSLDSFLLPISILFAYYSTLTIIIAVGSIAISFMEWKKGLITSQRFKLVTLIHMINSIGNILVPVFLYIVAKAAN